MKLRCWPTDALPTLAELRAVLDGQTTARGQARAAVEYRGLGDELPHYDRAELPRIPRYMPNAPPRPCPSCGRLVRGRCPACTKKREQARGSAAARGYDRPWSDYAARWLRTYPWCGQRLDGNFWRPDSECTQRGERVRAECVDHIVPLRAGGARLDPKNLQSLCTRCNLRKAARQNREAGR